MRHKVKVTVIDKKCFTDLQRQYCADPAAGPCPCYNVGTSSSLNRKTERAAFGGWDRTA